MSCIIVLRAFLLGVLFAFVVILMQYLIGEGDLYVVVSVSVGSWLIVHYVGVVFFLFMVLVVWLLICDVSGCVVIVVRIVLLIYVVGYLVFEVLFGIVVGIFVDIGNHFSGVEW